jgi:hypothetical protein
MPQPENHFSLRQQNILAWLLIALVIACWGTLTATWMTVIVLSLDELRRELLAQHFVAIVGLPAMGAGAFLLVVVFRHTEGPIEFEALGFKFKGAAAPIVLWILSFLAMVMAAKLVW